MNNICETREEKIRKPLLEYFSRETNIKIFIDIVVLKKKHIPLRLLDWFVTNYAKAHDVYYIIKRPNNITENFSVYRNYLAQLKCFKKKEFDPFCRGKTFELLYENPIDHTQIKFETAICQLKFFKWAIENLVLNYVETNYDTIYQDMEKHSSRSHNKEANAETKKKNELSKSIFQQIHISTQPITLKFPSICV